MAKPTIQNIWGQGTSNKYELTESQISEGIIQKSNIVSNQLNSVANRSDVMIDNLQRVTAWNALKTYNQGDTVQVLVSLTIKNNPSQNFLAVLTSTASGNINEPLQQSYASSFVRNDDYVMPLYNIQSQQDTTNISDFVNDGWDYVYYSDYAEIRRDLNDEISRAKAREAEIFEASSNHISFVYPVGSIYTTVNKDFDPNASFTGTSWVKIKNGLFLEATDNPDQVGVEVEAGLPNITGSMGGAGSAPLKDLTGAFYGIGGWEYNSASSKYGAAQTSYYFNASRSSAVYGKSTTVQPNSIRCYMWRRVS